MASLYDGTGELTGLGRGLRVATLIVGIASGLALFPASFFALFAGSLCNAACTTAQIALVTMVFFSPLLFAVSAMSGVVAFQHPTPPLILFTWIPATSAAIALSMV